MIVDYKGFEITASREECLGGYTMVYYDVYEKESGYCLADSFMDTEDALDDVIQDLKRLVDEYLENPQHFIELIEELNLYE